MNIFTRIRSLGEKSLLPKEENTRMLVCESSKLRNQIEQWVKSIGWEWQDFGIILNLIGLETPIELVEISKEDNSFNGITPNDEKFVISLESPVLMGHDAKFTISTSEISTKYVIPLRKTQNDESLPSIKLDEEIIKREGKELVNSYYGGRSTLTLNNRFKLEIVIWMYIDNKSDIPSLTNWQKKVNEYLLSLDKSLKVDEVYRNILLLLDLTDNDIKNISYFDISFVEKVKEKRKIRSRIFLEEGTLQEYAVLENGETFHIWENGNWIYFSDTGVSISYSSSSNEYSYSIVGSEEDVTRVNPAKRMIRVKRKISTMWEFIK